MDTKIKRKNRELEIYHFNNLEIFAQYLDESDASSYSIDPKFPAPN